jgi:bla regulator protein blaR1
MRTIVNEFLLIASGLLGASLLVKTTVVSAVALMIEVLARRRSAAVRHVLLAAEFAILLGLPLASIVLPAIRIRIPIARSESIASQAKYDGPLVVPAETPSEGNRTSKPANRGWNIWKSEPVLALWLAVFLLLLIPIATSLWWLRTLRRSAVQWTLGQLLVDSLAAQQGIERHVFLVLQPRVSGPMIYGSSRPTIFLPDTATLWTNEDLQRALVHELEHVKRGDWVVQCLARIVCTGYWFNPLVWIAWRRLVLQAERACDDAVLQDGDPIAYADQLVDTAQRVSTNSKQPLLAMANRSELAARVHAVLDPWQRRTRAGWRFLLIVFSLATVLVFVMSSFQIITTAQPVVSQWQKAAGGKMSFEVASIKEGPSDAPGGNFPLDGGNSFARTGGYFKANFPAFVFIGFAYKLNPPSTEQKKIMLDGVPDWVISTRYTIEARASGNPTKDQFRLMMQNLLAERFHLAVHYETHEIPVYALSLVSRGKLGLKLRRHTDNPPCSPAEFEPTQNPCGNVFMGRGAATDHRLLQSRNIPMALLADYLFSISSGAVDRLVLDRTGLSGGFDFTLDFLPEDLLKSDLAGSPFVDALHEQLGLKLEPTKAPVQILRIDHVDLPSKN